MRSRWLLVLVGLVIVATPLWAAKTVPQFNLKNIDGVQENFKNVVGDYKVVALVFWMMSCDPCKEELAELNKIAAKYDGFGIVAVACDTARTSSQVKPYVKGQGYKFDVLLDEDANLQKGMGVPGCPYSFLVTATGEVIWEHSGYRKGDEKTLAAEVEKYLSAAPASAPGGP